MTFLNCQQNEVGKYACRLHEGRGDRSMRDTFTGVDAIALATPVLQSNVMSDGSLQFRFSRRPVCTLDGSDVDLTLVCRSSPLTEE